MISKNVKDPVKNNGVPTNLSALVISNATININNKVPMGITINRDLTFVQLKTTINPIATSTSALTALKNIQLHVVIEVIELVEASIMDKKLSLFF